MDVRRILEDRAKQSPGKLALIFKEEEISFGQLRGQVLKLAWALHSIGIGKGDRVAVYLPNCPQYVYSYLASFCLGAVGVPLDFMLKADELISCLEHSEAKILIAKNKNDISLEEIQKSVPSLKKVIVIDEVL